MKEFVITAALAFFGILIILGLAKVGAESSENLLIVKCVENTSLSVGECRQILTGDYTDR